MRRLLLSLLPIPALAAVVALSCSRTRSEEPATRVIPPATYPTPAASAPAPAARADEPPTAEEVKEFQRPVAK